MPCAPAAHGVVIAAAAGVDERGAAAGHCLHATIGMNVAEDMEQRLHSVHHNIRQRARANVIPCSAPVACSEGRGVRDQEVTGARLRHRRPPYLGELLVASVESGSPRPIRLNPRAAVDAYARHHDAGIYEHGGHVAQGCCCCGGGGGCGRSVSSTKFQFLQLERK